jgi:hypothetical protein
MAPTARLRLSKEVVIALAALIFLAAALVSPDWIERTLDASPDGGDGRVERGAAFAAAAVSIVMSWLARRDWRALTRTESSG